ncbi:uncharacterized protein FTOL_03719 [Fusarium torulosum]|uniref:AMP-dependent synthetase/ligase domain-containing protein n=1 Tax=Fusarium torulosum TaxID=33205 RepID=A0AAE8M4C0_9HYPO|nr:uncharacterized protein FTOL_03719 [Fusarium torulosum]
MSNYRLHITVTGEWVKRFNEQGYQLCFASGVKTGEKTNFNVIAATHAIANNITVQWSDNCSIAASQDSFEHGMILNASTDVTDIQAGQSYTLPENWTNGVVNQDSASPPGGFKFINKTNGAGAIVYRRVGGKPSPIYFSSYAPLPPGTEDLTPVSKVKVWFSRDVQPGTMISHFDSEAMEVDLSGRTQIELGYDGRWSQKVNVNLLRGLTKTPRIDGSLASSSISAEEDIANMLQVSQGPAVPLTPGPAPSHQIDLIIRTHGLKPGLKTVPMSLFTYEGLGHRVDTIAETLIDAGVASGDIGGVLQQPGSDWICRMLAAFRVGATYLPLLIRPLRILLSLETTGAAAIDISSIQQYILSSSQENSAQPQGITPINFTVVSTGVPKGTKIKHSNLVARNEGFSKQYDISTSKSFNMLQQSVFSFDFPINQTLIALYTDGYSCIVLPEHRDDPFEITRTMLRGNINYTSGMPSEYEMWF